MSFTSIIRGASPQLVHLGVAFLILGYAASSYFAVENNVTTYTDVATRSSLGYDYKLLSSSGIDTDGDGLYEVVSANFDVSSAGTHLFAVALKMTWQTKGVDYPHYLSEPLIRSGPAGDLYYTFIGFGTTSGEYAITDQPDSFTGEGPYKTDNATLTTAWFQVRQNPLIPALWGGGWLMGFGIVLRMSSERNLYKGQQPDARITAEPTIAAPPPSIQLSKPPSGERDEDYYRRLLGEELNKGEEMK